MPQKNWQHPCGKRGIGCIAGACDLQPVLERRSHHACKTGLVRVVGIRDHQRHIDAAGEQDRQAAHADIVISEDDGTGAHHSGFSSSAWIT